MILEGSGGLLPRKTFENLHTVMGILALFEQFAAQILFFCPGMPWCGARGAGL